jgi:hypothetical protein
MRRPNKILSTFEIANAQLMQSDVMIVSWNYFWKPEKDDRNPILLQTIPCISGNVLLFFNLKCKQPTTAASIN